MVSIHVLATPMRGRLKSASVNPMALNMERAPARSRPSVIPRLMCLRSIVRDYRTRNAVVKPEPISVKPGACQAADSQLHGQKPSSLLEHGAKRGPPCGILQSPLLPEDAAPSTWPHAPRRN